MNKEQMGAEPEIINAVNGVRRTLGIESKLRVGASVTEVVVGLISDLVTMICDLREEVITLRHQLQQREQDL